MATMKFDKYTYLWPPRPETKIEASQLGFYSKRKWVAQYKKNGTCTVLFVTPEKDIIVKTRHDADHKMWKPTAGSTDAFKKMPGDGWYVFVCEVLHSKTKRVKDTVYIFDILVNDGENLEGTTFIKRQEILKDLFEIDQDLPEGVTRIHAKSHYIITPKVWLARLITGKFKTTMAAIQKASDAEDGNSEDEGLVLKNPNGKLKNLQKQKINGSWQVKCRCATENYSF